MDIRELLATALPILEEANRYTANNLANVDTPGFEPQQVDFEATMRRALAARRGAALHLTRTDARHLGGTGGAVEPIVEPSHYATHRTDGNRVDVDYELSQLARNQHGTLARLLNSQNRLIRDVLRSQ